MKRGKLQKIVWIILATVVIMSMILWTVASAF